MGIPRHNTWFWLPRTYPDTPNKDIFHRANSLTIAESGDNSAVTSMDVVLTNTFAPIPIIGHQYASAQFLGPGQTQFQFVVHNVGSETIREIQKIVEETQSNARKFRRVKDCARVYFSNNAFLKLAEIKDGIVESVDSWTESGTTDLYGLRITFTVDGQHTERLNQEFYTGSDIYWRVVEKLVQDISVNLSDESNLNILEENSGAVRTVARAVIGGITAGIRGAVAGAVAGAVEASAEGPNANAIDLQPGGSTGLGTEGGLRESARGLVRLARDAASDAIENGLDARETLENIVDNRNGIMLVMPRTETRRYLSHTNNANTEPIWYRAACERLITLLVDHSSYLPLHGFFEGNLAGKYFKVEGSALAARLSLRTQATIGILQSSERNRQYREKLEQGEITQEEFDRLNEIQREAVGQYLTIRDASPTEQEKIVSTDLNEIPPFLKSVTYGSREYFVSRNDVARPIREYLADLLQLGKDVLEQYGDTEEFEASFPGLYEQWLNSLSRNTNPTYSDMNLPPHPVSERIIDTDPDFYFWNDSEESGLNEIGADLDARINRRLDRTLQSLHGIQRGEVWQQTYLGRNLYGPDAVVAENHYSVTGAPPMFEDNETGGGPANVRLNRESGRLEQVTRHLAGNPQSITQRNLLMSPSAYSSSEDEGIAKNRFSMMQNTIYSSAGAETLEVGPIDQVSATDNDLSEMGFTGHSQTRENLYNLTKQAIIQSPDETLTMRRAFPTFKLYFLEDDTGQQREHLLPSDRRVGYFDDFYNYNSVKDIRIIRDKESPSSIAVITLTNISGILDQRMWNHQRWDPDTRTFINVQRESWEPALQETELENPLDHLILKQGLKIQLRLGHRNNANKLPIKFNGEIVEIGYNHSSPDLITIVAQSYGAELVLEKKSAPEDNYQGFVDTSDLLHSIMCSPELVHFGRFEVNPQFNPAEARSTVSDGTGRWTSPSDILNTHRQHLIMTRTPWLLANNPADDNIFAPTPGSYSRWFSKWDELSRTGAELLGVAARVAGLVAWGEQTIVRAAVPEFLGEDFFASWTPATVVQSILKRLSGALNPLTYIPQGVTIWEMFKEMELRHPGYVANVRPYGTRMTMFYGIPDQRYWADQITRQEMQFLRQWERLAIQSRNQLISRNHNLEQAESGNTQNLNLSGVGLLKRLFIARDLVFLQMPINGLMGQVGTAAGKTFGRFRPFRKYHLLTSDNHILLNNIRSSEKGTFNAVTVHYNGNKTYTLKADDNIPDYKVNMQHFTFENCSNETMARRYCIGLLMKGMNKLYKGELVVTGQNIDPHDAIMLYDSYTDMYGPFEVRQVVDTFSRETGWITEITPDMCVHANEYSTTSTMNLMNDVGMELYSRYATPGVIGAAAVGVGASLALTGGLAAAGFATGAVLYGLGGYYFMKYTQDRQPIWINPLILNNRPFTDGLHGFKNDGVFANISGRIEAEIDRVADGWQAFHLAGYINDWTIGTARDLANQTGGGTYSGVGQLVAPAGEED